MKFLKDRKAIETVEAAITFPIAILIMLALTNLGLVVFGQQAVQAAARHGACMMGHAGSARVVGWSQPGAKPKGDDACSGWSGWQSH